MGKLFQRKGIEAPGHVNLKLDGVFQEVYLDNLSDEKLEQLYLNKCRFVEPTPEGRKKLFPEEKPIEVKKIDVKEKLKK
jgi:hypothetical protein